MACLASRGSQIRPIPSRCVQSQYDNQAYHSCSPSLPDSVKSGPNVATSSECWPLCVLDKCTHMYLCMCVNVFIQACLCALTKQFNGSQSLSFAWFWQIYVLYVWRWHHFEDLLVWLCVHVFVCVCTSRGYRFLETLEEWVSYTYADNYVSVCTGKPAGWNGRYISPQCVW